MHSESLPSLLTFANNFADIARSQVLTLAKSGLRTEWKDDNSPVTNVDRALEEQFRELVKETYPEHGIIGEEYGAEQIDAQFIWTIDPIDGTENFIYGQEGYGILIGLRVRGEAVLGVIDHPEIGSGIRVSGGRGLGVRVNGKSLNPLCPMMINPKEEIVAFSSYNTFQRGNKQDLLFRLLPEFQRTRMLYACHAHSMALQGQLGAVVEVNLKIWDVTPAEALFPEVGGGFREINPAANPLQTENRHAVFGKKEVVDEILLAIAAE